MELNVNGKTYKTDIDLIDQADNDAILIRFNDAANKTVAAEWLNRKTGLMERVDTNGAQECDPELYEALLNAADEKIMDIGKSLGHSYTMNSGRVSLLDEVDPELLTGITESFEDSVSQLYTNDIDELIEDAAKDYAYSPMDYLENLDEDSARSIMANIYEALEMEADKAYQEDIDLETLITDLDLDNEDVRKVIADRIYEDMRQDADFKEMYLDGERESLTETLKGSYNLLKEPENYLLMGSDMGWRQLSGYKLTEIKDADDLIDSLHGDYDYTLDLTKNKNLPYLEAVVYSHDAPTGEYYKIVPASYLKDVFDKAPEMKETILKTMKEDDDVEKFVKMAIPELAKDDIVAGILTVVARTRGEEFQYMETLNENRQEHYKNALAYGLVHADYEQIHNALAPVVSTFNDKIGVAYDIENSENPLRDYPDELYSHREDFLKKDPAVKAMRHMLDKAIPQKIKKTANALFGPQRKNELKRLEKMGKNLDTVR